MGYWTGPRHLGPCSSPLELKLLWSHPLLAASATEALDAQFPLTWAPVPSTDLQGSRCTSEFPVFELFIIRKTTDIKLHWSSYVSASFVQGLFVMNVLVLTLVEPKLSANVPTPEQPNPNRLYFNSWPPAHAPNRSDCSSILFTHLQDWITISPLLSMPLFTHSQLVVLLGISLRKWKRRESFHILPPSFLQT